jgi:hypothetical protein
MVDQKEPICYNVFTVINKEKQMSKLDQKIAAMIQQELVNGELTDLKLRSIAFAYNVDRERVAKVLSKLK